MFLAVPLLVAMAVGCAYLVYAKAGLLGAVAVAVILLGTAVLLAWWGYRLLQIEVNSHWNLVMKDGSEHWLGGNAPMPMRPVVTAIKQQWPHIESRGFT